MTTSAPCGVKTRTHIRDATRDGMPKWWNAYNESKHDLPKGYEAGSMENAYLALAGLYVLHVMARQYYRECTHIREKRQLGDTHSNLIWPHHDGLFKARRRETTFRNFHAKDRISPERVVSKLGLF